jgi:outer membrane receptor protein involved in Fe transport
MKNDSAIGSRKIRALLLGTAALLYLPGAAALAQDAPGSAAQANEAFDPATEIVVTARQRNETLISVPVAVSAISGQVLTDYAVTDIADIAKLAPSLSINRNASGGAGSIALRGISTSASNAGFEQAVSVNIDGVQTSRGRILTAGLFDVEQVDVLKGPQALFFGKNSPAGVISIRTAGPTDSLEAYANASYEFIGDEPVIEGAISGPLSESFGARLAVRYRNLDGFFRNTAGPVTNSPFAPRLGGQPTLAKRRPGEEELMGRFTLTYNPAGSDLNATLKLLANDFQSDGAATGQQLYNCGAFPAGIISGVLDPYGECKFDRNFQTSGLPAGVADNWPDARQQPYLDSKLYLGSLTVNYDFSDLSLTSVTGYLKTKTRYYANFDATSFNVISTPEHEDYESFTQELRLLSKFDGPLNFLIGAFFQDYSQFFQNNTLAVPLGPDPTTGKFHTWEKPSGTDGNTYSVFGQLLWDISDTIELAGGIRYTRETKDSFLGNSYVHAPLGGVVFSAAGRVLTDNFEDSNYSPEITLTWRPTPDFTAYGSYKTGYKSGGLGLSAVLTPANVTADAFTFEPERIKGFEGGIKTQLLDRRLTLTSAIYTYEYSNLQVNTFNAATTSFTVSNAASARVKGVELEASFRPLQTVTVYGSIAYNDASYTRYIAGCYGGQTFAQGCNVSVASGPDGIANTADDTYSQDLSGNSLARAPKWTANAGFNVDVPVGDAMKIGFTGNARYSDSFDGSENASPAGFVNSYWLLDASARIGTADDRWQLSLIGRNLTNEYYTNIVVEKPGASVTPGTPSQTMATPQRGRQVLLQVSFRY